jgi:hypothetical protein
VGHLLLLLLLLLEVVGVAGGCGRLLLLLLLLLLVRGLLQPGGYPHICGRVRAQMVHACVER